MSTGRKTYNHAINWSDFDEPMEGQTLAEQAKAAGWSVGVVTSVPWSHATPAGFGGAHDPYRYGYVKIAREMLNSGVLDVMMGGGNPDFDGNGKSVPQSTRKVYRYVGGPAEWNALKAGAHPGGWTLIESKADFEKLTQGPTPKKVVGTAQVAETLQYQRDLAARKDSKRRYAASLQGGSAADTEDGENGDNSFSAAGGAAPKTPWPEPYSDQMIENVPDLKTMALGAINCLDDNPKGFYLLIEGGAVDWANHDNFAERMIEEQSEFVETARAVAAWIEAHGGWKDNLLVLTADHDCGLPWGENSRRAAFEPITDNGPKKIPGLLYNSTDHSNSLVPVHARGAASEQFQSRVKGKDETAAKTWNISGEYIDNTDIYFVTKKAILPGSEK